MYGNALDIALSKFFTSSVALFKSADLKPSMTFCDPNTALVSGPSGVKASATLFKNLSTLELLYASSLPRVARAFAPLPIPAAKGVNNIASLPNFNLFMSFLVASCLPPSNANTSNCVGPLSNRSPKLPISSTSATNASPAAPPTAATANLGTLAASFNLSAICFCFAKFLDPALTSLPAFFASKYLLYNFVPSLKPAVPGTPICTRACVSLPTPVCSAISSNGLSLSKNISTCAAVFVSKPRSTNSAPSEKAPSTTLIPPDTIPASPDVYHDASLFCSAGMSGCNAIYAPMLVDHPYPDQTSYLIYLSFVLVLWLLDQEILYLRSNQTHQKIPHRL